MTSIKPESTLTFLISKWWGYIFSTFFLLYGGVTIILSMMDSNVKVNYNEMMQSFAFLVIGIVLVTISFAFRDAKSWGWYGLLVVNIVSVLSLSFRLDDLANLILAIVCLAAVVLLFLPSTKSRSFGGA